MTHTFEIYILLFVIYSFSGWLIEVIGEFIKSKKFINRGFLIGPVCPIYGVGGLLITLLLSNYSKDYFAVFGLSAILCGSLEYFTSYIMEKLFNKRWWDYSNYKYNINGRVCLEIIVLFALAGLLVVELFDPLFSRLLSYLSKDVLDFLCISFGIVFIFDLIISLKIMNKIKDISISVGNQFKDSTEEISLKVKEIILAKSMPYRRIIEAFPNAFATKVKESKDKIVEKASENINNIKEKASENISNIKEKASENISNIKEKASENISNIKEKASENISNIKEKASENISSIKKKAIKAKIRTVKKVKVMKYKAKKKFNIIKYNSDKLKKESK